MDNSEISEFYDQFSEKQLKTGANERLISLHKRMVKVGLINTSNVLELGCGVGVFTRLLSKSVKKGEIEAVDLSPKSIELASKFIKNKNITLKTGDVVNYRPQNTDFDFITLMDVIEHIPLENHALLFANLSEIAGKNTQILINIPNPRFLEFMHKHHPETLQLLDQPVEFLELAKNIENAGLEMVFYEKYSIWIQEDYEFFIIRKKRDFQMKVLSEQRNLPEKIVKRIQIETDKLKYT